MSDDLKTPGTPDETQDPTAAAPSDDLSVDATPELPDDLAPEATAEAEPAPVAAAAPAVDAPARKRRATAAQPAQAAPASTAYAIVRTGGKQYRVKVGDRIRVERLEGTTGGDITLDQVLLVGGDGGTRVGLPTVEGASVTARLEGQERGEKIVVFKYKPKKGYRRKIGHRQSLTQLTVTAINA